MTSIIAPQAASDIRDAVAWYERQREGLGDEFYEAVATTIREIESAPRRFPTHEGARLRKPYRRAIVKRFPYVVSFEVLADDVRIVAVTHGKRRPGSWRNR